MSKSLPQKYKVPLSLILRAKKNGSNLPDSKSILSQLRKLSIERITTAECTQKYINTDCDNPLTQYENYDIDTIDDSAPQNIEEKEFS